MFSGGEHEDLVAQRNIPGSGPYCRALFDCARPDALVKDAGIGLQAIRIREKRSGRIHRSEWKRDHRTDDRRSY